MDQLKAEGVSWAYTYFVIDPWKSWFNSGISRELGGKQQKLVENKAVVLTMAKFVWQTISWGYNWDINEQGCIVVV